MKILNINSNKQNLKDVKVGKNVKIFETAQKSIMTRDYVKEVKI